MYNKNNTYNSKNSTINVKQKYMGIHFPQTLTHTKDHLPATVNLFIGVFFFELEQIPVMLLASNHMVELKHFLQPFTRINIKYELSVINGNSISLVFSMCHVNIDS